MPLWPHEQRRVRHQHLAFISEGLVDEVSLHVVPIFLGGGTRLFGDLDAPLVLDQVEVDAFDQVTHLRYRLTDR